MSDPDSARQFDPLNEENEFYDPETASSSGMSDVPNQPLRIPSPSGYAFSRDFRLSHYTEFDGYLRKCFFRTTGSRKISPSLPRIAMRHGEGLRREPLSSTIPTRRFSRNLDAWNSTCRTGGVCSQSCTMETPRYGFLELHFGKFPDPNNFQCWTVDFKTEVRVSS